ncbi:uncharacterized protein MONOS_2418 [Monocercomonoides exilis]|uniref:uncharacterized protein n=1 Tax=Monocercomonoides exilis TaxID=2049356 RepID=UPI00355A0C2D|nr:hypothetical protein MONOS_2418 [Monocercomonoides exilis]|eukprot:MONOS_2418.1-p1 / transcript=MONOS_2418.1 / gene=MONOS_2418 / organism=Monocercomonoides_exilis_PA203 / gene_product=unspecified product / transcript_product=unspecified product / location=Mono_scaffold00049:170339-170653(-) / protein_length=105 / sequence_SO=supercontig / SO=protein_coding / is_pseudo=false
MEIEVDLGVKRGRRGKKEGLVEGDERGERGVGDGEGGGDWGVRRREEIIWGGEEGEGENGRLRDEEGEVREGERAVCREEEWVVFVIVIVVCVDLAGRGENGGS